MAETINQTQSKSSNAGIKIGPNNMVVMGKIGKKYESPYSNGKFKKSAQ
jgi:hypothetical protein